MPGVEVYANLPGWRPVKARPQCIWCRERMRLHVVHRRDEQPPRADGSPRPAEFVAVAVRYGYRGDGRFCSVSCGYAYALAQAGGPKDHSEAVVLPPP